MTGSETWIGPRERAVTVGVEHLGDAELVAIVLGTGRAGLPVSVLAAMLLEERGGIAGIARAGIGELEQRAGIGRQRRRAWPPLSSSGGARSLAASLEPR